VFLGGWGDRAVELLGDVAQRSGGSLQRSGSIAILGPPGATAAGWRCWVSGRIANAAELSERFPGAEGRDTCALAARVHAHVGASASDLLRGTFVLVSLDLERDEALVARDHLGGRPLVYAPVGNGVLFAEHEREILDALPAAPRPDRLAVAQWLERLGLPAERTLYEGISRLPAAHRLRAGDRGIAVERYWVPRYEGTVAGSREEVSERLGEHAFDAVERAAEGSRRPAVRLSGGLDSACVAAGLRARVSPRENAVALSAVFPSSPDTDESELIAATAAATGLALERIALDGSDSLLAPSLRHLDRWQLPPATQNLFVWEPVMARARALGIDAMLDGEGGDELFGLAPYLIADRLRAGRLLGAWGLAGRIPGVGQDPSAKVRLRALRIFGVGGLAPDRLKRWKRRRAGELDPTSLLAARDLELVADLQEQTAATTNLDGPLWWRSLARDLTSGRDALGVSGHLRRGEVTDGVERRHPFLFDRELVDIALSNPPQLQFDPIRDRVLLRDALAGRIPEQVRGHYSKSDFTPLLVAALRGRDGTLLAETLAGPDVPVREFLRGDALDRLLRGERSKRGSFQLWQVGMANLWLRGLEQPEYPAEVLEKCS
jgi:asparagine synthase (glutamine-hydrolysing)